MSLASDERRDGFRQSCWRTAKANIRIVNALAGRLAPLDKSLMVTFGAGLTWGASLVEWNSDPA